MLCSSTRAFKGKGKCGQVHAKKEIVALYKEIVEGTISDGWI